jgi:hypothetical protein
MDMDGDRAARSRNPDPENSETSAQATIQLATSYRLSQAIYVFTQLGIPDLLPEGAKTCHALARATGAHAPSLYRLLRALSAWAFVTEPAAGSFALAPRGAHLRSDVPGSARAIVLMFGSENFWTTWGDLLHCVQTGETAFTHLYGVPGTFDYLPDHPADAALFNAAMANVSTLTAAGIVRSYDFSAARTLVDVGGGRGALIAAILEANPALRGTLFDLPSVVATARPELARAGVADRCEIVGGDVFSSVPAGGDIYLLARVIHDWDDEKSIAILTSCRAAMAPSSRLLLVERAIPERIEPSAVVRSQMLGDLNMLVRNGGRERTEAEYRVLLAAARLRLTRTIPSGTEYSIIEAVPS